MITRGVTPSMLQSQPAFMNCVVEPANNGIGGEGVMAIHLASGENVIVDYVGRPSKDCTPNMYKLSEERAQLDGLEEVLGDDNVIGHKACVRLVQSLVLTRLLRTYGKMKLSEVIAPAISVAEEGFPVGWGQPATSSKQ